jgi:hypothetical protein
MLIHTKRALGAGSPIWELDFGHYPMLVMPDDSPRSSCRLQPDFRRTPEAAIKGLKLTYDKHTRPISGFKDRFCWADILGSTADVVPGEMNVRFSG